VGRQVTNKLNKTSEKSLQIFFRKHEDFVIGDFDSFKSKFLEIVSKDVRLLKDCSERAIVDFYEQIGKELLSEYPEINDDFWKRLTSRTRTKLAAKYTSNKTFDNNIDIYFNEVKREYILHPQGESEEMEFCDENKDVFIKNNLKLVVECARRYQNLGLPLEDLIQIGNVGLLTAFERFDTERANLRFYIIKDIENFEREEFTYEESINIIKQNFKYTKLLDSTLNKIPKDGFKSKEDFINWTNLNIKKASFASISFIWIRAMIIIELNKYSKIIKVPKKSKSKNEDLDDVDDINNVDLAFDNFEDEQNSDTHPISIIRLDSINPHTEDNYFDNVISDSAMDEFIVEDESLETMERQTSFKMLVDKALDNLSNTDRRIVKKRYGIDYPYQLSINEIAENENLTPNKVKYIISNAQKIIMKSISAEDKRTIIEMLK
jgi:RNA polymerase sigma factor (sigma-70 family)